MPFLSIVPFLEKKSQRNVLTSGAASTYMFTSFEMSDDTGVLLGVNRHNNSLCIVDLFNTKKNKNANLNLLGTSGAGKTFTMQLLALRMRMRGIQCFILAPIKGHEFRRACNHIGGQYIKLSPGSPHCINVMEIRHTLTPEMELIDELDYSEPTSMLAQKVQQLMIFFSLLIPDMSNEEEQLLDEALIKTYSDFGITHDNDSLYIDKEANPPVMKKMPILGDLHKNLLGNKMTERIAVIVSRFVTGSAQSFNKVENKTQVISEHIKDVRFLYTSGHISEAYEKAMQMDKTEDERYFILTLFAIAKELESTGRYMPVESVDLAVGLPPEHYGVLKDRFANYFKRENEVRFVYNDKPYCIVINHVMVFPQAYAAVIPQSNLIVNTMRMFIVDIGGYTTDVLLLRNGKPDMQFCRSLESGIITMNNEIARKVNILHNMNIDDEHVSAVLSGKDTILPQEVKDAIVAETKVHAKSILDQLRELQVDLRSNPAIFVGGGSVLLRPFIENSPLVAKAEFISSTNANTIGYDMLGRMKLSKLSS